MFQSRALLLSLASVCALGAPPDFLLPDDVIPVKQRLELTIDPARSSFQGFAQIEIRLQKARSEIWLNGKDLSIRFASIEFSGKTQTARAQSVSGEFIRLAVNQAVGPGHATLSLRYRAPLSAKAVSGPFRKKVEGRWYAFTVFTPIDARRAFPCFDEPRFKTPWELSIRVKRTDKAFANAPEISETNEPRGTKLARFASTQPLPAEVVAFAVGPFEVWDGGRAGQKQIPVRVITPMGHAAEGKEAALATAEILPRLESYTGLPYPWEKLDHIALPEGAFGATENPGLITYRSRGLLIAAGDHRPERRAAVRAVEAHEIAHQWFGNLVTQASWKDVWLSEGFATWLAAKILDQDEAPALAHLSALAARERIMAADSGAGAQAVRTAINSREDLKSVYNRFVYQKGAAVLFMLENWLGEGRFEASLQAYLKSHAMANATTSDLAAALSGATNRDPGRVMHSFLDLLGFPSVSMDVRCQPGAAPRIVFQQSGTNTPWAVPVCWRGDGVATSCTVLDSLRGEVDLSPNSACPAWVFPNAGGAGYYRTLWTGRQLAAITGALDQLSPAERITLVYDLAALSKAGSLSTGLVEPVLGHLASDPEPKIAHAARIALGLENERAPVPSH